MNKLIYLLFLTLFVSVASYSQDSTAAKPIKKPWAKGDVFVGVNSEALGVSVTSIGLSPSIGYAVSDDDMLHVTLFYTEDPRVSTFKAGWYRRIYHSAYLGLSGSIYGEGSNWNKAITLEFGVARNLFSWLVITPKIAFIEDWSNSNTDFHFTTGLNFAIKLKT